MRNMPVASPSSAILVARLFFAISGNSVSSRSQGGTADPESTGRESKAEMIGRDVTPPHSLLAIG